MAIELDLDREIAQLLLDPTTSDEDKKSLYRDISLRTAQSIAEKYHALISLTEAIRGGNYHISKRATPRFAGYLEIAQIPFFYGEHIVGRGESAGYVQRFRLITPPDGLRAITFFDTVPNLQRYKMKPSLTEKPEIMLRTLIR